MKNKISKNKDILLINPPDNFATHFQFGLLSIASSLQEAGFNFEILDFMGEKNSKSLESFVIQKIKESNIKIVGLSGMALNYLWLKDLSLKIKSEIRNIVIVAGGHWAYHEPEIILETTGVDIVVNGEGDYVTREICKAILENKGINDIKGITYKDNGSIKSNGSPELIFDLDMLPLPAYNYFDMNKYLKVDKYSRSISMQTGRGCIGSCMFCTGEKQVFRKHSPNYILNHIKLVKDRFGINEIRFKEALTLGNKEWIKGFCTSLIREKNKIRYECISRIDTIDEEIVKLLKDSGCFQIQFGIESGDDYILSKIARKKITSEQAKYVISLCLKNNIVPRGGFIIGLPGETIGSLGRTLRFIWSTKVEETGVTFPTPFSGTRLFSLAVERFHVSKEALMSESDIMDYSEESQHRLIEKYNFTDINPLILKLYRFLFNETFLFNRLRKERRYIKFLLEIFAFLELRLLKKISWDRILRLKKSRCLKNC